MSPNELRGLRRKRTDEPRSAVHRGTGSAEPVVAEFLMTMPKRYRERYAAQAVRVHARIAYERGGRPAHVGCFDSDDGVGPALCVVAPDALGLLAAISASLMLEGFDIMDAEAYTRRTLGGGFEAVDLFWVRRQRLNEQLLLTDRDADAVRSTLVEVLSGSTTLRPQRRRSTRSTPGAAETRVHFLEHSDEPHLTLELETNDRPGLLLAVTTALFSEDVLIVGSRISTRGQRVHDSFDLVEVDGSRISGTRLQRIQLAVLSAVDDPNDRRDHGSVRPVASKAR